MTTHNPSVTLDHVNFTVANLEASIDWYGRVFGFEVVERGASNGVDHAILRAGDTMLCIYEYPDRAAPEQFTRRKAGLQTVNHFSLRIYDRAAWEATVARERLEVNFGGVVEYPHSSSWYVIDPTGYEIEVVYWPNDVSFAHAADTV